jgi:hypothetical protein
MKKNEIQKWMNENHQQFIQLFIKMNENDFMYTPAGKWSMGQQLDHIVRSAGPVAWAFRLPSFVLRMMFGKTNRPSRSFEALIEKYHYKLETGGRASGKFIPNPVLYANKERLLRKLQKTVSALNQSINRYSEEKLDTFILPHPLLGKLTLREMLYFTFYHVQHHLKLVEKYLGERP